MVRICNTYWENKPLPLIPAPWPLEMQDAAEAAALVIQERWIRHVAVRRQREMLGRQAMDRTLREDGILSPPGAADARAHQGTVACPTPRAARHELEQDWCPPDMELAREYADWNHPRVGGPGGPPFPWHKTTTGRYCVLGGCGEQLDLWDEGQVSELSLFGAGNSNFFKFEKWAAWTMLILTGICTPMLLINTFGSGEPVRATGGLRDLVATTLGNLIRTLDRRQGTVAVPFCAGLTRLYPAALDCTLTETQVAMLYTYTDVAACLFLYVSFLWMKAFQKREAQYLDRHTVTASDFTVQVTNVPPAVTETDLKVHFARALNLPVVQVALGYDNAQEIEQHKERGVLMKKRNYVVNRCRFINGELQRGTEVNLAQRWFLSHELHFLQEHNERLLKRIGTLDTQLGLKHLAARPLCAFVTFYSQEAYMAALEAYNFSLVRYLCMPDALRLRGHRLRLRPAPEPSLVLWENLQFGPLARIKRKLLSIFLAGSLISVSIVLAFVARYYQDQNSIAQQQAGTTNDLRAQALATTWTIVASCSVVAINYALQLGLQRMTEYQKSHSLDQQQREIAIQVFVLKFINTGGVLLLLNSKEIQDLLGVQISQHGNFVAEWFWTTGLSLLLVMLLNVVSPVAPGLQMYVQKLRAQRKAARGHLGLGFVTQEAANLIFMGPEFPVSIRYSAILVTFFVCFVYAAAMPLLLLIGALTFYVGYWVDKFLFLRFYRIPPQYGRELSRGVANTIQVALLLHILVSMWAFGQDQLFDTPVDVTSLLGRNIDRLTLWVHGSIRHHLLKVHIQPLLALLVVLGSLMVGRQVVNGVLNTVCTLVRVLTCRKSDKPKSRHDVERPTGCCWRGPGGGLLDEMNCVDVSYPRAVERGLIKGLHTYNILQNPSYAAAFGIGPRFAERHCHVESIRGHLALPFDDDESEGGDDERDVEGGGGGCVLSFHGRRHAYDVEAPPRGLLLVSPPPNAPPPPPGS